MTSIEFRQFEQNIAYARNLISSGRTLEEIRTMVSNLGDLQAAHPDDLYRAAWVQAISALDHWLHREIIRRAIVLINDTGRERPDQLARLAIPFGLVEKMRQTPVSAILRDYLEDHLGWQSFQAADKIQGALRLVVVKTASVIWTEVSTFLGMTPDAVKKRHAEVVSRRNQIAHEADLRPDGTRRPITADEATAAVSWIADFAGALVRVLG